MVRPPVRGGIVQRAFTGTGQETGFISRIPADGVGGRVLVSVQEMRVLVSRDSMAAHSVGTRNEAGVTHGVVKCGWFTCGIMDGWYVEGVIMGNSCRTS